jgi:hypothetical protein
MNDWVDGCTSKKRQERGWLAIRHFRGVAFCFLMFLLFACYGIWGVVLHGMLTSILDIGGGTLLLGFFCLVMCDLLMGKKKVLGEGRR